MNIEEFTRENAADTGGTGFELENKRLLDAAVDGIVYAKAGAMVAHSGDLTFTGKSSAEGGVLGFVKESVTGEGTPIMEVEGTGNVFLADHGKKVQVLSLSAGDELTVNGDDVLAFDSEVTYEIRTMDSAAGVSAGGLTNVYLQGPGEVAITTHGDPIVLTPPVNTDPAATVAWSGVTPEVDTDLSLSDTVGQSSGESIQLAFTGGDGVVVVQPYEEIYQ
jgi:uncharacterized protein (AIM24 family)